jgi:hypothetical protein
MNVRDFIAALGGTRSAALVFGVGRTAVHNWTAWNRLPARLHLRAAKLAATLGIPFDPDPEVNHDISVAHSRRKTTLAERVAPGRQGRDVGPRS